MRHMYALLAVVIVTALILSSPTQSAPTQGETLCIVAPEPGQCFEGEMSTQQECLDAHNFYLQSMGDDGILLPGAAPIWKAIGDPVTSEITQQYNAYCVSGCCDGTEELSEYACQNQGGSWEEGICPTTPTSCANGATNCVCDGQSISTGEYCCDGTVTNDATCSGSTGEEPDEYIIPDTCGNGEWDTGEICDGEYLGICPTGDFVQSCTMNCRCAINSDLYEEFDGYCYPGAPGCDQETTCADMEFQGAPTVQAVTATNRAEATWEINVPESCEDNVASFVVIAQADTIGTASPVATDSSQRSAEFEVQGDRIAYEVFVRLTLTDGTIIPSPTTPYTSGHEVCFTEQRSMCTEEGRTFCNDANVATEDTDCPNCYQGIGFDGTLQATCGPSVVCDACNTAYNNFGEVNDGYVPVEWGDETDSFACENLNSYQVGEIEVALCRLEYTDTALQEYLSCEPTEGCAQYGTQDACAQNICGSAGTCEWNAQHGICTAQEIEYQVCDAESEVLCQAQGSGCRWVGSECVEHRLICEDYNDEQTCTGGTPFSLDPNTNQEIAFSEDAIGLGKCKWGAPGTTGNICYKDANDNNARDRNDPLSLRTDFTNPTTTLLGTTGATWGSTIRIPYVVTEEATTYADLIRGTCGEITRPVNQHGDVILFENRPTGDYCLHYYSEDRANNLEYVRQVPITVDTSQLAFTDINITIVPGLVNGEDQTSFIRAEVYLNRLATCSVSIEQLTPEPRNIDQALENYGPNDRFVIIWPDQPDGQYQITSECNIPQGTPITNTTTILLNSDRRMTLSLPESGVYTNDDLTQTSIHTLATLPATCTMQYGTNTITLQPQVQSVVIDNDQYIRHTASMPQLPQGFNELIPTCEFADFTLSNPVLNVHIGIDEQPPITVASITVDDVERTISEGTIPVGSEGRNVQFHCTKEEIVARGNNWNAECETVYIDTGSGFNLYSGDLRMDPGDTVRVYSVDSLGNEETPKTFTAVNIDVSGPRLECFWIEEDSAGTVSSQCD